jgi:hypothetical protein
MTVDRVIAAITAAMVAVVMATANHDLGWVGGWFADGIAMAYLAALLVLAVHPNSVESHAVAAAGATLFWGGRLWALGEAHATGDRDLRTAMAVHLVACASLMGHHYRSTRRIGLERAHAARGGRRG